MAIPVVSGCSTRVTLLAGTEKLLPSDSKTGTSPVASAAPTTFTAEARCMGAEFTNVELAVANFEVGTVVADAP
ncbi:hypothetical protein GCM10009765_23450 [Fodinicola feengrottensis]|uniref:Uncharacterized protein n=1 Tax=Fodinicola feengrottensis TaxID=435914 RepID=A0ABP4SIF5_9ACTN